MTHAVVFSIVRTDFFANAQSLLTVASIERADAVPRPIITPRARRSDPVGGPIVFVAPPPAVPGSIVASSPRAPLPPEPHPVASGFRVRTVRLPVHGIFSVWPWPEHSPSAQDERYLVRDLRIVLQDIAHLRDIA